MKKVLLATTVLAMSATVAAAEVAVTGEARLGVIYNGNTLAPDSKAKFTSRVRVKFAGSGETDGGLSFGFSVRADQSGQGNTANNDSTAFISGAFGKLTFGDNDTAANALVGHVNAISLTGLGDNNELGYIGQTDTSVLYEYTTGGLTFALSAGQLGTTDATSVAVKYAVDGYSVALGYEQAKVLGVKDDQLSLAGEATFSNFTVKAVIADRKSNGKTQYALSGTYTMDALSVSAFYANKDTKVGAVTTKSNAYGIGASYDLGGGATVKGGIQKVKGLKAVADFGVAMKF